MHYTNAETNLYNPTTYTNTETVINTTEPQPLYQYNVNTNTVPSGYIPPNKGTPDFSPRVAHKRVERDEPLEEGLVMHIREAFLPFNDPAPTTRASKRYAANAILFNVLYH